MKTHAHKLDSRELATVLAALRCWQTQEAPAWPFGNIATGYEEHSALSSPEIDALCERLNLDGMPCALTDELLSAAADELTANIDCMRGPEFAAARGSSAALGLRIRQALTGTLNPEETHPPERHNERRDLIAIARACIYQGEQVQPLESGFYSRAQETTAPGQLRALADAARATLTRCGIAPTNPPAPITTLRRV